MKKLAGIAILSLTLTGCASTGGLPTNTQISDTAKQIQNYTRTFCSFVPTVQTVVSIISASAGSALGIATDICAAVTTAPLAEGGARKIVVRGVVVKGKFVR